MQIENWNINDVKPFKNNARVHEEKSINAIKASVDRFDWLAPICVDSDGVIIAGHGRWEAAKQLGLTEVPVLVADWLSDNEVAAAREADNMTQDLSYFDWDALNINLGEIDWLDIDMSEFGFKLDDELTAPEIEDDDYTEQQADEAPSRVQRGDIWQLGTHRLMCGDSTSETDVETLIGEESFSLMMTDPPYGINADKMTMGAGKKDFHRGDWDGSRPDISQLMQHAQKHCIWGGNYFTDVLAPTNDWLCWHKKNDERSFSEFELAWTDYGNNCRHISHHWGDEKKLHVTMKPLDVIAWAINQSDTEGNVIDLFGGSGTTLIACEQLNRKCYMMELDPHYCDVIIDRWENLTGNKAVKIN